MNCVVQAHRFSRQKCKGIYPSGTPTQWIFMILVYEEKVKRRAAPSPSIRTKKPLPIKSAYLYPNIPTLVIESILLELI